MSNIRETFIFLCLATSALLVVNHASAADPAESLISIVEAAGHPIESKARLRASCDDDLGCIARFLVGRIGNGAKIVPELEDTDARRNWSDRTPAVISQNVKSQVLKLDIKSFDARAVKKVLQSINAPLTKLILNLGNMTDQQDISAMRNVAGIFLGANQRAFKVAYTRGRIVDWSIQKLPGNRFEGEIEIWVGERTAKAAEVFAVLMRQGLGARILGEKTAGDPYIQRSVPLDNGWVFLVPTAVLTLPDFDLTSGVMPEGPRPID